MEDGFGRFVNSRAMRKCAAGQMTNDFRGSERFCRLLYEESVIHFRTFRIGRGIYQLECAW